MSSEQQNKPHRTQPGSSAGDVSDAKIITPGSARPAAGDSPAPAGAKASATPAAPPKAQAAPQPPAASGAAATPAAGKSAAATVSAASAAGATGKPAGTPAPSASPSGGGAGAAAPSTPRAQERDREMRVEGAASGGTPASSTPSPALRADPPRRSWSWLLLLLLILLLAGAGWWYMQQRFLADERQNALRLQQSEARAAQLEEQIRQLREDQAQIQARGNALETRFAESAAQQEQLQALYDDVARVRGDSRLAEVERALDLANQHLALAGNVKGALLALEGAEKQLADNEESKAIGLRRVILQDIERLKSLPEVDLTRSVARLDEVLSRIDTLPFLSDPVAPSAAVPEPGLAVTQDGQAPNTAEAPASDAAPTEPVEPVEPAAAGDSALKRFYNDVVAAGSRAVDAVHQEFNSLVKIRRIDDPDRLLLAPDQKRTIREGLRLQLLNARISLLNRNEALFRADLARSVETLNRYFDAQQPELKSSIAILTELQSEPLQLKLPSLSDSMEALAATRAESEKRF